MLQICGGTYIDAVSEIQKKISEGSLIARGNGRSYGDSAIGEMTTVSMKNFNKIIFFDENTGELIAQAECC